MFVTYQSSSCFVKYSTNLMLLANYKEVKKAASTHEQACPFYTDLVSYNF